MDDDQLTAGADAPSAPALSTVRAFRRWLASLAPDELTDRERIDLVAEIEQVKGTGAAAQTRLTHAVRRSREAASPQDAVRSVGAEVALARRQSPTLGDRFVGMARALVDEMPHTMSALTDGACSEQHALLMVQVTSVLSLDDRAEVDRRVGPLLGRLGVRATERAARRVAAELDVAAVVKRHADAVSSRRVTVRPAPDGMAYLTVLGPMVEVVGASAALRRRAQSVVTGQCPDERPSGRGVGAVAADTALRLLSGREVGQVQPAEVHLVMTDRSLLGTGDQTRSVMEPARIPGHGSIPAPVARAWLRAETEKPVVGGPPADTGDQPVGSPPDVAHGEGLPTRQQGPGSGAAAAEPVAQVWLRRLYTSPDGRDLVAMDSHRRVFTGLLRRMLVLRDDVCTTPWCDAPIAHADHTTPARSGGLTTLRSGTGKCARCNYGKEAPGWLTVAVPVGAAAESADPVAGLFTVERHDVHVTTPLGRRYVSQPPPLLGWGSSAGAEAAPSRPDHAPTTGQQIVPGAYELAHGDGETAPGRRVRRVRRVDRERDILPSRARSRDDRKRQMVLASAAHRAPRFRFTPHLERELCRFRT